MKGIATVRAPIWRAECIALSVERFIGGYPHGDIREREAAFVQHLQALGLPLDDDHVRPASNTPASGAGAFRTLIELPDPPTAVVTATDQVAIGALHAAHDLGVRIPGQVSVVGFDDIPIKRYTTPPLTTVHQPINDMAAAAVDLAIANPAPAPASHRVFPTSLAVRRTSGPAPNGQEK